MWTYRNEPSSNSAAQDPHFTFSANPSAHTSAKTPFVEVFSQTAAHAPVTTIGKSTFSQRTIRPKKQFGAFSLGALLYLAGILLGALWRPGTDSWLRGNTPSIMWTYKLPGIWSDSFLKSFAHSSLHCSHSLCWPLWPGSVLLALCYCPHSFC